MVNNYPSTPMLDDCGYCGTVSNALRVAGPDHLAVCRCVCHDWKREHDREAERIHLRRAGLLPRRKKT